MNISNLFFEAARKHPEKLAIIDSERECSFKELADEVKKTANYFHSKGIRKNDRVLVLVPMGLDLYRIVLAIFSMGATAVFIDEWADKNRIKQSCKIANCKGLVASKKVRLISLLYKETRTIPIKLSVNKISTEQRPTVDMALNNSALITFTTGSTGKPKAADRTHEFLAIQFGILQKEINPQQNEVDLVNLPIILFINLAAGCTSVIPNYNSKKPSKTNWSLILNQISNKKVNRVTGSPYFTIGLAEYLNENEKKNSNIKKIFTGGGPVFSNEAKVICNAFPQSDVTIVYGASEAEPISLISASELIHLQETNNRGLPVGKPHESIELKIIPINSQVSTELSQDDFDRICMEENEIGEIVVSGESVLHRYFNNQSDLKELKIHSGNKIWHRTGDSGFLEKGKLFLTGRCDEIITHKDRDYSLFMIENELKQHPGIKEGTLLQKDKKYILYLELIYKTKFEKGSFEFPVDEIKIMKRIPLDPRHNTKIDYKKLREIT